jgi:cytochrome c peroxidase
VRRVPRLAVIAATTAWVAVAAALAGDDDRIRLSAWKDGRLEIPRGLPSPWVPPSNPVTDAKLALGRRLFFDRTLSRDGTKGCVDCHAPEKGYGDGLPTAVGVRGQVGHRNVPSLLNAAIYPALFWDGRAVSLEAQAEGPLLAPTELDMTEDLLVERIASVPSYAPLFEAAFGSRTVTLRRVGHALAAFQRTLLAADSPFDRFWFDGAADALSPAAKRGHAVFVGKGACASCHTVGPSDAAFTDFGFHATGTVKEGATDVGRSMVTGDEADRGRFRTPTLRNVALTAPYLHDGSARTLAEVVDHYDRGGTKVAGRPPEISPLHLTPAERADLVAFLEALTSPAAAVGFGADAPPAPAAPTPGPSTPTAPEPGK